MSRARWNRPALQDRRKRASLAWPLVARLGNGSRQRDGSTGMSRRRKRSGTCGARAWHAALEPHEVHLPPRARPFPSLFLLRTLPHAPHASQELLAARRSDRRLGRAVVHHVRVGQHVHAGGPPRGEGTLDGWPDVFGPLHQLPIAAECLHHAVIANAWLQVRRRAVPEHGFLWMLDLRPLPIVANHPDDGQVMPAERLELHAVQTKGAVAEEYRHLLVWPCQRSRCPRRASPSGRHRASALAPRR